MFCYQCEQTSQGQGCQTIGVCGKDENTATLQDLLIHAVKGISQYAHRARQLDAADPQVDAFAIEAIFATLTNVNFDEDQVAALVYRAAKVRDLARSLYTDAATKASWLSLWADRPIGSLPPSATLSWPRDANS
jgi:hydroxylamine reductase